MLLPSFRYAVPSVAKYYDIKNYTALAPEDIKELVEAYQKELKPWFDKVMAELKGIKLNEAETKLKRELTLKKRVDNFLFSWHQFPLIIGGVKNTTYHSAHLNIEK